MGIYPNKYSNKYLNVAPNVVMNLVVNILLIENINYIIDNIYNSYEYDNIFSLLGLAISVICADIWFYLFHIFIHKNKFLYKHIHKTHHIYSEPFAFSSFDSTFIEHIVINIGSVVIGPIISGYLGLFTKTHTEFFILFATYTSCVSHSSYSIKHYLHHKNINCNYGQGTYLLDRLFKTYKNSYDIA